MFKFILLILLSAFSVQVSAQSIAFDKTNFGTNKEGLKEALGNIKEGDKIYEKGARKYAQALPYYLKANEFNPNNAELNYKIGECYLGSPFKAKSLPYLKKALELDKAVNPEIRFLLGQAYQLNMEWEKAIKEYQTFKQNMGPKTTKEEVEEINKCIAECGYGATYVKNPVRVFIDNIGKKINSADEEYSPVISADESVLMFTSRRKTTTGGRKDLEINDYFEDIYLSVRSAGGEWQEPVNMGKSINSDGHDANVALSPDGHRLIVYSGENNGDLYESKLKGDEWQSPKSLGKKINTPYHESSATYSPDGKYLYFVTDNHETGLGGHDIYKVAINEKGKLEKPENLGPTINTPYHEDGVFMHADGKTLYFSSEGHSSMGSFDIFKSVYENGKWSEPENLGYPINTPDADVFFVLAANGKHGYYASAKADGQGGRDLYQITFLGPEKPVVLNNEDNLLASLAAPVREVVVAPKVEIKIAQVTILKGVVSDNSTKNPVEATIDLVDNSRNEVIATFNSNSKSGRYLVTLPSGVNYGISVKADGYLFHSENFDIPATADYQEVTKDIGLKKADVGAKIVLNNIFFDFDKATLRPESAYELDRLVQLLNEMPKLKIELSGHTDNKGSATYNQKLSEDRAKSVVTYLITKGVKQDRLTSAGYGFAQPVATNDTEEGRQLNRRTEMKIMGN